MQRKVSIILPTYNRARFLPQAIESIRSQEFNDWELIIVDDGSTDGTAELLSKLTALIEQPVRCIRQENQGAFAGRNTGLDYSAGKYIAFFDSDDVWLPHHLQDCVDALDANPEVDWVYAACKIVEFGSSRVIAENTFYHQGRAQHFQQLQTRESGSLKIIQDKDAIPCMIEHGLYCGLQSSVIRSCVFDTLRIPPFRIGEDRLLPVFALKKGYCFGYFDKVHVIYQVHDANTSGACQDENVDAKMLGMTDLILAYEFLLQSPSMSSRERRSVRRRIVNECFWNSGYAILWNSGRRKEALKMYRRGLAYWPWNWRCWKTYLLSILRYGINQPHEPQVTRQ